MTSPHLAATQAHVIPYDYGENGIEDINGKSHQAMSKEVEDNNATPIEGHPDKRKAPTRNDGATESRLIRPDLPLVFDLMEPTFEGGLQRVPTEDTEIQANSDQAQLLAWHYRLGHLPFKCIQQQPFRATCPFDCQNVPLPNAPRAYMARQPEELGELGRYQTRCPFHQQHHRAQ